MLEGYTLENNNTHSEHKKEQEKEKVFSDIFDELGLHNKDIPIEGNVRQGM